jgi:osmotically-inducible protein OsmY
MTAIAMTHETGTRGNDVTKSLSDRDLDRNTVGLVPQIRAGRLADTVKRQAVRETDASQRALADQRTEARITAVLNGVDAIKTRARDVYVSVSNGVVTLYGAVRDSGASRDIEKAIRTNTGLDAVQNNIHTIGAQAGD